MTDDLMRALHRLAERGEPIGVEAMVERIDTELGAGSNGAATGACGNRGPTAPAAARRRRGDARRSRSWPVVSRSSPVRVPTAGRRQVGTIALTPDRLVVGRRAVLARAGSGADAPGRRGHVPVGGRRPERSRHEHAAPSGSRLGGGARPCEAPRCRDQPGRGLPIALGRRLRCGRRDRARPARAGRCRVGAGAGDDRPRDAGAGRDRRGRGVGDRSAARRADADRSRERSDRRHRRRSRRERLWRSPTARCGSATQRGARYRRSTRSRCEVVIGLGGVGRPDALVASGTALWAVSTDCRHAHADRHGASRACCRPSGSPARSPRSTPSAPGAALGDIRCGHAFRARADPRRAAARQLPRATCAESGPPRSPRRATDSGRSNPGRRR